MFSASYPDDSARYAFRRALKTFPWLGTFRCSSSCTMTLVLKDAGSRSKRSLNVSRPFERDLEAP